MGVAGTMWNGLALLVLIIDSSYQQVGELWMRASTSESESKRLDFVILLKIGFEDRVQLGDWLLVPNGSLLGLSYCSAIFFFSTATDLSDLTVASAMHTPRFSTSVRTFSDAGGPTDAVQPP